MRRRLFLLACALIVVCLSILSTTLAGAGMSASPTPTPTSEVPLILAFGDFAANEARFNPSAENPAALVAMFSLTFTNQTGERLEVKSPRLKLSINGIGWTDLASTDFQMGRLQPGASQTIELQSMMLKRKLTPEQEPVWQAILEQEPLDLVVTGTILAYPGGEEQVLTLEKSLEDFTLPGEWGVSDLPQALAFGDFAANEARFNPSAENPAALVAMFSLTFTNQTGERLEVKSPRLKLSINGIAWTDLASTDFQMGRLQPGASQTIELQSMMLKRKLTPEQEPVWQAILEQEPLDLVVTGTILAYPGGEEQVLTLEKSLEDFTLPGEWERP